MSLCGLSTSHGAPVARVSTTEVRPSARKVDHPGSGNSVPGSNGGRCAAHCPTAASMAGGRQSHTNASSSHPPSGQNSHPAIELPHPGMKFIDANANRPSASGSGNNHRQAEVPFAPRPSAATQQRSDIQNPSFPYSNFRNSSGPVPARTHGRSAPCSRSSRKPVTSQPLAATALGSTASSAQGPQALKSGTMGNGLPNASDLQQKQPPRPRPHRNVAKKRPLPLIMEMDKMVMPEDFLPAKGEVSGEDLYTKLPALWANKSNPDDIYVNWTNPSSPSLWELTKIRQKEPPIIPPQPGTPSSSSSESSFSTAASSQSNVARRTNIRGRGASVVTQVYADSRYIGVATKKAKLMHQSTKTQKKLGPLDFAQFRDYRLLPIDYFVAPMEGFQTEQPTQGKDEGEKKEEEEVEEGRPRRSRRQPQQLTQQISTPPLPKETKKKKRQVTKTSVFVGKNHQVDVLPPASNTAYKVDRTMYKNPSYASDDVRDEQIWDPQRADAAERRGEDIEGFLQPARELNSQAILLQALHQADYCVSKAELKFVDLYRASKEPSTEMSDEEKARADILFETSRKDFSRIAKALNRSVAAVLAQYYYWKSMEKRGGTGGYARLKNMWKNEEDHCCVCDDGGILIVCDHCHKAFHLECLKPPLKEAPETDWYCAQCLKSPAKLRRMPSITLGTTDSPQAAGSTKPSAMKALSFSTQGQKEAPPFAEQPPVKRQDLPVKRQAEDPPVERQAEDPPVKRQADDPPGKCNADDGLIDLTGDDD